MKAGNLVGIGLRRIGYPPNVARNPRCNNALITIDSVSPNNLPITIAANGLKEACRRRRRDRGTPIF
jgi:hypothetical protein